MFPENENELSVEDQEPKESPKNGSEFLNDLDKEKPELKEPIDTSDLSLIDVDTKPSFLNKGDQTKIEVPEGATIKSAIRKVAPRFTNNGFPEKIVKFTITDKNKGVARKSEVYKKVTETFWAEGKDGLSRPN